MLECDFGLKHLGHIISVHGVEMDPEKIEAAIMWPRLKSIRSLHPFPGMLGYYRKFINNYGLIAKSLANMLKKGTFV